MHLVPAVPAELDSSNFHRLSIAERRQRLATAFPDLDLPVLTGEDAWADETANLMVENCIGTVPLPLGIGLNVVLNGVRYVVPMAVEEPSVIAAASVAAKLVAKAGGFRTKATANLMFGQVQLLDVGDTDEVIARVMKHKDKLIDLANTFCDSMKKRGGGVLDLRAKGFPEHGERPAMVVVYVQVDVRDAMGANVINTICEGIADELAELSGTRVGLRILSNLCTDRVATAFFQVPAEVFDSRTLGGHDVAKRIVEAWYFADVDPYRAVTHNKGILNGVDSVALATGQDWRAIEAAAHAYAARDGRYRPLSTFALRDDGLWGELTLPLAVGTQGGALKSHPTYRYTHGLLGNPDAQTLAQIMVAVGLAQNLAALRALATEGIQAGHMPRHARNIAVAAGVPQELAQSAAEYMTARSQIQRVGATDFMGLVQVYRKEWESDTEVPSTASFRIKKPGGGEVDVAFPFRSSGDPLHVHVGPPRKGTLAEQPLLDAGTYERLESTHASLTRAAATVTGAAPSSPAADQLVLTALALGQISRALSKLLSAEEHVLLTKAMAAGTRPTGLNHRPAVHRLLDLLEGGQRCFERQLVSDGFSAPRVEALRAQQQRLVPTSGIGGDDTFVERLLQHSSSLWPATTRLLAEPKPEGAAEAADVQVLRDLGDHLQLENFVADSIAAHTKGTDLARNAYSIWLEGRADDADMRCAFCCQVLEAISTTRPKLDIESCLTLIWANHGLSRPLPVNMPRRRVSRRHPVSVAVIIEDGTSPQPRLAHSIDLSQTGLLLRIEQPLPTIGQTVRLEIVVPENERKTIEVHATARVVRRVTATGVGLEFITAGKIGLDPLNRYLASLE